VSYVLDTSVTMAWLFEDEANPRTERLLDALREEQAWVPSLWYYEVGNVLAVAERRGRIKEALARHFTELLRSLPIYVDETESAEVWDGALTLARTQLLSVYDAAYLDLAMKSGLPLATLDNALKNSADKLGVELA